MGHQLTHLFTDFKHPLENPDDREYDHMSGHAMMATCPPYSHIKNTPNQPYPFKMPELNTPDLTKLLDLSSRLPLGNEGEITPIMAWTQIIRDPRCSSLSQEDLYRIRDDLSAKVRCYGYGHNCALLAFRLAIFLSPDTDGYVHRFGAVLEEFELTDAVENVLADKSMRLESSFSSQPAAIMA